MAHCQPTSGFKPGLLTAYFRLHCAESGTALIGPLTLPWNAEVMLMFGGCCAALQALAVMAAGVVGAAS